MEQRKPIFLSYYLIGINIIIFALIYLIDPNISGLTMLKYGALYPGAFIEKEFYRLITPIFLHFDLSHLLFNMFGIFIFGRLTESIFGKRKFLIIYFLSGISGVVLSYFFNLSISAGASGSLFGLLGANLYLYFKNKEIYKRVFGYDFFIIIGINLFYGFTRTGIDNWGHLGGLIGGLIAATIVKTKTEKINSSQAVAILAISFAVCALMIVYRNNQLLAMIQ